MEPKPLPMVLVVEDEEERRKEIREILSGRATVLEAATGEEAWDLFVANQENIYIILLDACLVGNRPDTLGLIRHFRNRCFVNPIIAMSSLPEYRRQMRGYGCDDYDPPTKADAAIHAARLLTPSESGG